MSLTKIHKYFSTSHTLARENSGEWILLQKPLLYTNRICNFWCGDGCDGDHGGGGGHLLVQAPMFAWWVQRYERERKREDRIRSKVFSLKSLWIWVKISVWLLYCRKKNNFRTNNFFGIKIYFLTKIFFGIKLFFSGPKMFFDEKCFFD